MDNNNSARLIGCLAAQPSQAVVDDTAALVAAINTHVQPPEPIKPNQVHVRSLRLISDAVNDHGGRFPVDEHDRLCELLIDSPVLIGHDRARLPIARNFVARRVRDDHGQWVQVWFYWMRTPEGDRLAADIDGGVVKEGSIGFEFRRPECSVCGQDIRTCEHIPGREYTDATGAAQITHYEYRDIARVLETSLVYRGATPGTRLGNEPVFCAPDPAEVAATPDCELATDVQPTLVTAATDVADQPAPDSYVVVLDRRDFVCGRRSVACRGRRCGAS